MLVDAALIALNLAVWGAHARLPWRAARDTAGELRRTWALLAAPALLASATATLARLGCSPDAALAQGLAPSFAGPTLARLIAFAVLATLLADLALALGWRRLGPGAWRLAAALGAVTLPLVALGAERLRVGEGPAVPAMATLIGLAVRCLLALAAAEAMLGPRRLAPLAGAALPFYWLALPTAVRATLAAEGTASTLGAAALLLLLGAVIPERLRRPALLAGLLLAVLFLARAAGVGTELPERMLAVPPLPPR